MQDIISTVFLTGICSETRNETRISQHPC